MTVAPGEVRVTKLRYSYPTPAGTPPAVALAGVSVSASPGTILGLTGPAGAGKTTLCLALNGIVPRRTGGVFQGEVQIGDWSTRDHDVAALASRVAMVFQQPDSNFVGLSVLDEVAFGPEQLGVPAAVITQRATAALEAVGMAGFGDRVPSQLSGGQKQRVAIAAALAMAPAVLVLDEPTAALDPVGAAEVGQVLAALANRRETTIILASQDPELLTTIADELVVLDSGSVIAHGSPAEVYQDANLDRLRGAGVQLPMAVQLRAVLNDALVAGLDFVTAPAAAAALLPLLADVASPRPQ